MCPRGRTHYHDNVMPRCCYCYPQKSLSRTQCRRQQCIRGNTCHQSTDTHSCTMFCYTCFPKCRILYTSVYQCMTMLNKSALHQWYIPPCMCHVFVTKTSMCTPLHFFRHRSRFLNMSFDIATTLYHRNSIEPCHHHPNLC